MKTLIWICLALALASSAHAETTCQPVDGPKAEVEKQHGRWIHLTTDQWEFLRGVYAVNPNTPPGLPPGDRAILAQPDGDKGGVVFFVDGGMACGAMEIPDALLKMLLEVDASNVGHVGAPT